MITYLNDRDWLIRLAFFESIVDVAACAGGRSLEEYILPLMVQALSGEQTVFRAYKLRLTGPRCRGKRGRSSLGVINKPL
jgi:phosphoinositide-3-kinase regulatory subunit 4